MKRTYCANWSSTTHFVHFVMQIWHFQKQALRETKESSWPQKKMRAGLKIKQKSFYGVYMMCAFGELKVGCTILFLLTNRAETSSKKLWDRQYSRFVTLFFDFWLENLEKSRFFNSVFSSCQTSISGITSHNITGKIPFACFDMRP